MRDDPTTGVDAPARGHFGERIGRLGHRRPSMSVMVATAYMDEAERFDWLVAMNAGKVLATGTPAELRRDTNETTLDRKSTRLNSSHANISYAVFCLKKKKKTKKRLDWANFVPRLLIGDH